MYCVPKNPQKVFYFNVKKQGPYFYLNIWNAIEDAKNVTRNEVRKKKTKGCIDTTITFHGSTDNYITVESTCENVKEKLQVKNGWLK